MPQAGDLNRCAAAIELVPENYFAPLDFASVFVRPAPIEVDLGCGDGSYLVALAAQNPARNFLGVERLEGRVRTACRKIARQDLTNGRVLRVESAYAVAYLFPAGSIRKFHLLFPDPWPKRRHQSRRVVTETFIEAAARALDDSGTWRVVTDQGEYFEEIRGQTLAGGKFVERPEERDDAMPISTFEKTFRDQGLPIFETTFRKVIA